MASDGVLSTTAKKSVLGEGGGEKAVVLAAGGSNSRPADRGTGAGNVAAGDHRQRKGKELVDVLGTEQEKKAIVINLTKARDAMRARCLAVGIFLSVLSLSTKQLVDHMKKIWHVRGNVDAHNLSGRRFVLEFTEDGDFNHVTRGGPWRYRGDAVLIEALKEGEDPELVTFTTVPIWAQFKNIPFYLLSKELTRELGRKIGSLLNIDNNARGDICNKFVRARVLLPINQALQRWITLADEVTDEDVVVSVFYERLPNFCIHCGFVGHTADSCVLPANLKKNGYSPELEAPPMRHDDPRCWFLRETTGQARRHRSPALPWRTPSESAPPPPANQTRQQAIVSLVANEVQKLTMQEIPNAEMPANTPCNIDAASPSSSVASIQPQGNPTKKGQIGMNLYSKQSLPPRKRSMAWRRLIREKKQAQNLPKNMLTTQAPILGAPRPRPAPEEDDLNLEPPIKKFSGQWPTLEDCLGAEGLRNLREQELHGVAANSSANLPKEIEGETTNSASLDIIVKDKTKEHGVNDDVTEKGKDKEGDQNLAIVPVGLNMAPTGHDETPPAKTTASKTQTKEKKKMGTKEDSSSSSKDGSAGSGREYRREP